MGFSWKQKNLSPIGIDFGTDSVKLIQMTYGEPSRLNAIAGVDIPIDARKDPDARQAFLTQAIREMLREGKFKGKQAVGSIPASQTYVLHVRIPKGNDDFVKSQLEATLRTRLPIDPARMVVRHYPVCEVTVDGQVRQEMLCMAATRETVMRHVQAMDRAGLEVVGMHCEPLALIQSFKHLFRRNGDDERVTFYIDIGSGMTKATITHGTDIVFAKNIQVAGEHFTRQLAKQQGVDFSVARMLRIQQAINQSQDTPTPTPTHTQPQQDSSERRTGNLAPGMAPISENDNPTTSPDSQNYDPTAAFAESSNNELHRTPQANTAVAQPSLQNELLESLIDDLQMCTGYHNSLFPGKQIEKIVFVGGESSHLEICKEISGALRLPAQLGNPLARLVPAGDTQVIGIDLNNSQPGWAVPMGLCLLSERR